MTRKSKEIFTCGLGRWRPGFLQGFATMKWFTIVYGLLGTIQAMSFVYFIATLTTLEKRFQIRSEITGVLMSGNELSQIFLAVILAYKGGKGNRPVWIAWGVLFSSMSCFIVAVPHFVYGAGVQALALTREFRDDRLPFHSLMPEFQGARGSSAGLCNGTRIATAQGGEECRAENVENPVLSLCLIFFSQFVLGVGTTLYITLGQPYLDDNTKRRNTPKLLGMTMALRSAGPAAGFVLGFLCLNFYIDPSLTPTIERSDPRWLGAWWLGWIILGTIMTIFSFLIACFPEQMNTKTEYASVPTRRGSENLETSQFEMIERLKRRHHIDRTDDDGLWPALKRVATNPLLIFNNFTAVFYILGASGYINFFAKYAEVQYHQSAAFSSMIAGVSTVVSIILGFLVSGFVISKFKPKETYLLLFNVFIASVYMAGEFGFLFLSCTQSAESGSTSNSTCQESCSCQHASYSPVCYEEGSVSFFSPCHAGCLRIENEAKGTYTECLCLPTLADTVRRGPCATHCTHTFIVFVAVQCLIQMIGCSGRITNVLINYRTVEPRDKPLAQGICLFMISLLAFIPGPIIYGKVLDSTCLIWDNKCGRKGNCWVYDKDVFRTYLNVTALSFTFCAFACDVIVVCLGRNLRLYEEEEEEEEAAATNGEKS